MSRRTDLSALPAWMLSSGVLLLGLALVARSQQSDPPQQPPQQQPSSTFVPLGGFGTSDSNGTMIAVTGMDVTGGSILYLIDTQGRHVSVYTAQSGSASQSEIKWVGARNIDLDLQVDGFNDKSEYKYKELEQRFADKGASAATR